MKVIPWILDNYWLQKRQAAKSNSDMVYGVTLYNGKINIKKIKTILRTKKMFKTPIMYAIFNAVQ